MTVKTTPNRGKVDVKTPAAQAPAANVEPAAKGPAAQAPATAKAQPVAGAARPRSRS